MLQPLELFIGVRYLRARRRNRYISFISFASMAGIAVGVAALIIVISVMNGFGNELRTRLVSLTGHVKATGAAAPLADWARVRGTLLAHPRALAAAPYVEGEGMLVNGLRLSAVLLTGVRPDLEQGLSDIEGKLLEGRLADLESGAYQMLIGTVLARALGLLPGDHVNLLVPRPGGGGGALSPRLTRFRIAGLYEAGVEEHDGMRALVHMDDAAQVYDLDPGSVTGVRLRLDELFAAPAVAAQLQPRLGPDIALSDWTREQSSYFRAVRIEKTMMFIILMLVIAVAAFNIVATLVMAVNDKRTDIAILRTMGLPPSAVMWVFIVQGTVIGLIGTLIGFAAGVLVALNIESLAAFVEWALGVSFLPGDLYYITELPSDLRWNEAVIIAATGFALAALATLYPARRAALTHPAEALRYE